jgi:sugar phosphate isomerase/epimerase
VDQYAVAEALKEIGYRGDYTLEAASFLRPFRPEFHQEALNFMAKVSRHLADIAAG